MSCSFPIEYIVKTPASVLPISIDELKVQARLDVDDTSEDTYLTTLIKAVVSLAESYMRRDIINRTYTAYLRGFPDYAGQGIQLQKAGLQSLTSIKYYVDNVITTFSSSNYYTTKSNTYSAIYLNSDIAWPIDVDNKNQAVEIEFVAGMGAAATDIPEDIKQALKQHATFIYQSRGDSADGGFDSRIPDIALAIYQQYKIYTLQ